MERKENGSEVTILTSSGDRPAGVAGSARWRWHTAAWYDWIVERGGCRHGSTRVSKTRFIAVTEALIVVDLQNDFCPGGALPVDDGDAIVPLVNRLLAQAKVRILTQDWHPPQHGSFAANHPAARPFDRGLVGGVEQVLWPVHCVQGTSGAEFHPGLETDRADLILRKGRNGALDSYSAFFENDRVSPTGLDGYLRSRGVDAVAVVGLALDFCVAATAIDAAGLGYRVRVLESACRAIDQDGSLAACWAAMDKAGVTIERGGAL